MKISRRRFVAGGLAAMAITRPASAALSPDQRALWLALPGGREESRIRFRTDDWRLSEPGVEALSWLWRDWRDADEAVWIDWRLFDILGWIQARLALETGGAYLMTLTSGYRTRERNARIQGAAKNSQHCHGRAADIVFEGVRPDYIASLALEAGAAGVGRYPDFTHVDVGPEGRTWFG